MKPRKKSKAFSFICAFVPGAAEMYTGFMRMGASLMAIFMVVCALSLFSNSEIFVCVALLIYAYSFFHARNIANANEAEFATMEDMFIWEDFMGRKKFNGNVKTAKRWFAAILIFLGVTVLYEYWMGLAISYIPEQYWNDIYPIVEGIPTTVFAVVLIILGIVLIKGKKKELDIDEIAVCDSAEMSIVKAVEENVVKATEEEINKKDTAAEIGEEGKENGESGEN